MSRAGLCDQCAHQRLVRNTRGSVFSLCELASSNEGFPKYPRVPVIECRGFRRRDPANVGRDGGGPG